MEQFVPYLVIIGLILVYVVTYVLNKKTPVPEECREIANDAACKSCHNFACSHKGGAE